MKGCSTKNWAVVGNGSKLTINGEVVCSSNALITGTVNGNVTSKSTDCVIEIGGHVNGNVDCPKDTVHLTPHATVYGDIKCKTLIADQGCVISGKVEMTSIKEAANHEVDKKKV